MRCKINYLVKLAMVCVTTLMALAAFAAPPAGVPGSVRFEAAAEFAGQPFNREEALQQRAEVHRWLLSEAVEKGLRKPLKASVTSEEAAAIDQASGERPVRVGLTKVLSSSVDFSDLKMSRLKGKTLERAQGAISGTQDGGFVYTMALSSAGAAALRVHFTGFRLPPQTGVFLYTEDGQAFGPYTGRGPLGDGEFWSHTLVGDFVILQLRHVGPASDEDLRGSAFKVAGLGHIRPRFMAGTCADNASCVVNADCVNTSSVIDAARDAVAHMQWISGPYIYMCTGGLLADTDNSSTVPYFLSAHHCISRAKDARSLENFFQLTQPCGNTACPTIYDIRDAHPQNKRTLGASIVSTGSSADYTLFRLTPPAPAGSAYLGWNAAAVANTNGTDLFRIHHPGGSPQSYSEHDVSTSAPVCQSWPRGPRIYSRDVVGATEGGSSGSPVMNASGQVVGQLSGACGTALDETCNFTDNATVDGAFAAYFSQVEPYLDPDPNTCVPVTEVCNDGIDNDCDGFVDANDSNCTGGGLPAGAACVVNSECASNNCKGKPGAKVCK